LGNSFLLPFSPQVSSGPVFFSLADYVLLMLARKAAHTRFCSPLSATVTIRPSSLSPSQLLKPARHSANFSAALDANCAVIPSPSESFRLHLRQLRGEAIPRGGSPCHSFFAVLVPPFFAAQAIMVPSILIPSVRFTFFAFHPFNRSKNLMLLWR